VIGNKERKEKNPMTENFSLVNYSLDFGFIKDSDFIKSFIHTMVLPYNSRTLNTDSGL